MTTPDTQYVWIIDGQLSTGTIGDYAQEWEACRHFDVHISSSVWYATPSGDLTMVEVRIIFDGRDGNDYLNYSLIICDFTVCAQIDGRA